MELKNITKTETRTVGIDAKDTTITVDDSQLSKVVSLLTTNLYSNKEGSLVREITSNAWDAHIAAGNDNPIALMFTEEEGNKYLTIRDFGNGLSEEEFDNVYRKLGTSTKNADNNQIGGFGIGKFSALAYAETVEITSYHEGKEYIYMMYRKGVNIESPLVSVKDSTEPNGLSVKVLISRGDESTFAQNILDQLSFFENLVIVNETNDGFFNKVEKFINDCEIYEGKYFKTNSNMCRSSQQNGEITTYILLGKVVYPINLKYLEKIDSTRKRLISNKCKVDLSYALKFNIGELDVTPNREEIQYSKEVAEKIFNKWEKAIEEINDLAKSKCTAIDYTDLKMYHEDLNKKIVVNLTESGLNYFYASYRKLGLQNTITYKGKHYDDDFMLKAVMVSQYTFKNGLEVHASCNQNKFSTSAYHSYQLENSSNLYSLMNLQETINNYRKTTQVYFLDRDRTFRKIEKTYYKSIAKSGYGEWTVFLDFKEKTKKEWIDKVKEEYFKSYEKMAKHTSTYYKDKVLPYSRLHELEQFFDDHVVPSLENFYDNLKFITEDDLPESFVTSYNASKTRKSVDRTKYNTYVYRAANGNGGFISAAETKDIDEEDIPKLSNLVVYGEKGDEKIKSLADYMFNYLIFDSYKMTVRDEITFIALSASNCKKIEGLYENVISIEEFMKGKTNYFRGVATAALIQKDLGTYHTTYFAHNKSDVLKFFKENTRLDIKTIQKLQSFLKKYSSMEQNEKLKEEIVNTALANTNIKTSVLEMYNSVRHPLKEIVYLHDKLYSNSRLNQYDKNIMEHFFMQNSLLKKDGIVLPKEALRQKKYYYSTWQK